MWGCSRRATSGDSEPDLTRYRIPPQRSASPKPLPRPAFLGQKSEELRNALGGAEGVVASEALVGDMNEGFEGGERDNRHKGVRKGVRKNNGTQENNSSTEHNGTVAVGRLWPLEDFFPCGRMPNVEEGKKAKKSDLQNRDFILAENLRVRGEESRQLKFMRALALTNNI